MPPADMNLAHARLHAQRLASAGARNPAGVVRRLGAVQAQDFAGAVWALALRMRRADRAAIDQAFASGAILRTHVMRPTWHFVAPEDLRWLLALTAPRVRTAVASYDRKLGIDATVIRRSQRAIAAALRGGRHLTRQELKIALVRAGVAVHGVQHLAHLVIHAELSGLVCSGPLRGKQFTYALVDERVPEAPAIGRDEALCELTRRYFTSHGPAQIQDFVWWSGLTTADARAGLDMAGRRLASRTIEGRSYWFAPSLRTVPRPPPAAHLLPPYDEYLIGYRDRSAAQGAAARTLGARPDPFSGTVLLDGRVAGGWTRALSAARVTIRLDLPGPPRRTDERLVHEAARRYGAFLGLDVVIVRH